MRAIPRSSPQAIAYAGQAETYHGEITPGLLERGVEIEEQLGLELEWNLSPRYVLGRRLMRTGEPSEPAPSWSSSRSRRRNAATR